MVKTFAQINQEFIEENNLIKADIAPGNLCTCTKQRLKPEDSSRSGYLSAPVDPVLEKIFTRLKQAREERAEKRRKTIKRMLDIILYVAVAFILITAVVFNGYSKRGFHLFGYSGFTVLGESMQREIPKGSLVLVKEINPDKISVGDDITFIRKRDHSAVTHRVVHIYEKHGERSEKAFQTKGIENTALDQDIIYTDDVIGIVKITIPGLGSVIEYISGNIGFLFVILGILSIIAITVKKVFLPNKARIACLKSF